MVAKREVHYVDEVTGTESKKGVEGAVKMLTGGIAAKKETLGRVIENRRGSGKRGTLGKVLLQEFVDGVWVDRGPQTVGECFWSRGDNEHTEASPLLFLELAQERIARSLLPLP
jgi:hypothetical protein